MTFTYTDIESIKAKFSVQKEYVTFLNSKPMKTRILFSTFLLIVVSGIILSCKKESTDPVPEAATVVNSWRIIEATNDSGKIVPVSNGGTIDIKSNGHFIIANSSLFYNGGGLALCRQYWNNFDI